MHWTIARVYCITAQRVFDGRCRSKRRTCVAPGTMATLRRAEGGRAPASSLSNARWKPNVVAAKLIKAARCMRPGPPARALSDEHWRHIPTNNPLERILREIKRWTEVGGATVQSHHSGSNPATYSLAPHRRHAVLPRDATAAEYRNHERHQLSPGRRPLSQNQKRKTRPHPGGATAGQLRRGGEPHVARNQPRSPIHVRLETQGRKLATRNARPHTQKPPTDEPSGALQCIVKKRLS